MSMATHIFISTLFVLHVQCTMLESGDDYYADSTLIFDNVENAKREENLGYKIYTNFVQNKKATTGCTSMRAWLMKYATDVNKWETKDWGQMTESGAAVNKCQLTGDKMFKNRTWVNKNPEFETDICLTGDKQKDALNDAADLFRMAIKQIAEPADADCTKLWHLMLCPVSGLRFISPYEFAFKSESSWTTDGGILVNPATKAYNMAKCGNPDTPCHKNVVQSELTLLFQHKKGRGPPKKMPNGDKWTAGFVNDGGLYEGALDNPQLKDFWIKEDQKIFLSKEHCATLIETYCTDTQVDETSFTFADEQSYDCAQLKLVCPQLVLNKTHGTPTAPWEVATATSANEGYTKVVDKFIKCGVPWVGGVSGSALEQFAYALWKEVPIDEAFVLQWMSLYVLSGFHSLGEVWAALKPMLAYAKQIPTKMKDVPVPFNLDGTCTGFNETSFLDELEKVIG